MKEYELTRKRIFCENIHLSDSNSYSFLSVASKKIKRNTIRLRKYYSGLKAKLSQINTCIASFNSTNLDIRPFVEIEIFGMKLNALLDSGASISCICGKAAVEFLAKNISYEKFGSFQKTVDTAGGNHFPIVGSVTTAVFFRGLTKPVKFYIIPGLKQDVYLGTDFWKSFGLLDCLFDKFTDFHINELGECENPNMHSLTQQQKQQLEKVIEFFPNFDKEGLGKTSVIEHTIEIEANAKPIKQRYFSISPAVEKKVHAEIDNMLALGVIEPAPPNCPWSSPVTVVQKEDKLRLCLDSRKLNSVTVKDAYPQPKIDGILSRLPKAEFISSLDLKHAFWQINLAENCRDMTAFTVQNRPLYRFKVMPFGLTNAPMTMCRLMDAIIPPTLKNRVFVYLDDLLLLSTSFGEHLSLLFEVAQILRKAGLTLNIKKCKWCMKQVRYLGYIVGDGCIKTDPDKVSAIRNISVPSKVKELQSFLGLAGWYRRFLKDYSALTAPLTDLCRKNKEFVWTPEAQKAFELVKEKLTTAPLLVTPDFTRPFIISCDACKTGIGGVLAQLDEAGNERPIAFFSQKLNRAQQNYSITELECFAALRSILKFREYVEGHEFRVITDHASLKWLMRQSDLNGRLARWSLKLQGFNFTIEHRKGSMHVVPDSLSRLPFDDPETVESFDILPLVDLESPEFSSKEYIDLIENILKNQSRLPDVKVVDNFVYKRTVFERDLAEGSAWKLWIPSGLIPSIIERAHCPPTAAHGGIGKTLAKLRLNFFWPQMARDVKDFITKCEICQQCKAPNTILRPPMGAQAKSDRPFQRLYMDFLGPYPRSKSGNVGIFIVMDHLTKFPLMKAIKKFCTSVVISYLEESVFQLFGVPELVITDNGPQFRSAQFSTFLKKYGVRHMLTAVYSPQSNSSERVNRSIIAAIRSYLAKDQKCWDLHLSEIAVALRSSLHTSLGHSPYHVLFGNQMITHGESYKLLKLLNLNEEGENILERTDKMKLLRDMVKKNIEKAYNINQKTYNLRCRPVEYAIGETVLRRNFSLSNKIENYNAKLAPKFLKSKVLSKIGNSQYKLANTEGKEVGIYHAKDMKKFVS